MDLALGDALTKILASYIDGKFFKQKKKSCVISQKKNMEKKRIFVFTAPFSGHTNPVASIVHELKSTNSSLDLIFYGTDQFRSLIEQTGATFRPYTYHDESKFKVDSVKNNRDNIIASFGYFMIDFSDHNLNDFIADVERDKPDLIMSDFHAMHARYLMRSLELRYKKKKSTLKPPEEFIINTMFAFKTGIYPNLKQSLTMLKFNIWFIFHLFMLTFLQIKMSLKHGLDIYDYLTFVANEKLEKCYTTVFPELQPKLEYFNKQFKFIGCCVAEKVRHFDVEDEKLKIIMDQFEPVNPIRSVDSRLNLRMKN